MREGGSESERERRRRKKERKMETSFAVKNGFAPPAILPVPLGPLEPATGFASVLHR